MKDIVWSQVLSVDVDEIDDDHRKLVNLFNMLNHAVTEGESPDYLAALLEELVNCTIWHFSHEERLMVKFDYQETDHHKAEHRELVKGAKELQHKVLQAGNAIGDDEILYLERWLTEHILTEDMRLGDFLSERM